MTREQSIVVECAVILIGAALATFVSWMVGAAWFAAYVVGYHKGRHSIKVRDVE